MKKKCFLLMVILVLLCNISVNARTKVTVNNPTKEEQEVKVLVIEINPVLNTITNSNLYHNNNGHPKVSEFFYQDSEKAIQEIVKDLEQASHGYLNISLQREYLNEFPTYKNKLTLTNGKKAHRFNEATYLSYVKKVGAYRGDWYNSINTLNNKTDGFSFDYNYIINKYNLVERRNNKEFDQVWLLTVDPAHTYETIMVGRSPYWINSPGVKVDCDNFLMFNITIARRDSNLHAFAHAVECIMNGVYQKVATTFTSPDNTFQFQRFLAGYDSYLKDSVNINTITKYNNLTNWEKFTLNAYNNAGKYTSVGNVHFPFNGEDDYDYYNDTKVYTNWREWLDYPNITGKFVKDNEDAWTYIEFNVLSENENRSQDRIYNRFWLYLMPHILGSTADGYSNNWWKYIFSMDFTKSITNKTTTTLNITLHDNVPVKYTIKYNSGKSDTLTVVRKGDNVHIGNTDVLGYYNGILYGKGVGTSKVTIYHDGKKITYTVNVKKGAKVTNTLTFVKNTASSISKTKLSCTTYGKYCKITMPTITPKSGYEVVGWATSKDAKTAKYKQGKTYTIDSNIKLYAITKKK